jgi:hypothetical protein
MVEAEAVDSEREEDHQQVLEEQHEQVTGAGEFVAGDRQIVHRDSSSLEASEDDHSSVNAGEDDDSSINVENDDVSQDASPAPRTPERVTSAIVGLAPALESTEPMDLLGFGTPGPTAPRHASDGFESEAQATDNGMPQSPPRVGDMTSDMFAFTPTPHKFGWSRAEMSPRAPESLSISRSTALSPPTSPLLSRLSQAGSQVDSPVLPVSPRSVSADALANHALEPNYAQLERTLSASSASSSIWGPPEHSFGRVVIPPVPASGPVANPRAHPGWENWKTLPDEQTNKANSLVEKPEKAEQHKVVAEAQPQLDEEYRLTSIARPSPTAAPALSPLARPWPAPALKPVFDTWKSIDETRPSETKTNSTVQSDAWSNAPARGPRPLAKRTKVDRGSNIVHSYKDMDASSASDSTAGSRRPRWDTGNSGNSGLASASWGAPVTPAVAAGADDEDPYGGW